MTLSEKKVLTGYLKSPPEVLFNPFNLEKSYLKLTFKSQPVKKKWIRTRKK